MRRRFSPERGVFTLIELLVVVAIISILFAVLLPAFKGAKEKVKQLSCQNNLKQIGSALSLYADDWKGYFPANATGSSWQQPIWTQLVGGYAGQANMQYRTAKGVFLCPNVSASERGSWGDYGANIHILPAGYSASSRFYPLRNISSLRRFSQVFLAVDAINTVYMTSSYVTGCPLCSNNSQSRSWPRHLDHVNVLFVDGHLQALKSDSFENNENDIRGHYNF